MEIAGAAVGAAVLRRLCSELLHNSAGQLIAARRVLPCGRSIGSGAGCSACPPGGVSARGGGYSRTTREPAGSERDAAA